MELIINNKKINIRSYKESDFEQIHQLNKDESWNNLVEKQTDTRHAWTNSSITYVVTCNEELIGYVRGLTDGHITLYICELLIKKEYRGLQIGTELLSYVHNLYPKTRMELLASTTSHSYYEANKFRKFYGFRRTFEEI
ncbi:GNAT family N-acetyltransferase [Lottiidibacillus patelloidae]|uniref:GNAT family N-acetyltransferase n=1 Tax=Lottiidibacillus patelloidae TaxID=2670334 RepID=A0A263BR45_9BACI|nr:GNAT family N-acetyltransferase [Lottiidibacillus patelloidae]OZM56180.1 GNAT family N-acetyltransferase [Lottiidibacillus patelloidae]